MFDFAGLQQALGGQASLTNDSDILRSYSADQAVFAKVGTPSALLIARNQEEVAVAVHYCNEHGIPIVARGAGSGLSGGANAIDGCLIISFEKLNRILDVDPINMYARVEPGVINLDLDNRAAEYGLAYMPDPASRDWSTIGGNIATNAGGMCCVKYGVTSHHVRALKVVLASGEIVEFGKATKKYVSALDLTRLIIGSEGTLGLVVEAVVNLVVRKPAPTTFVFTFENIEIAARAIGTLLKYAPSMLEIIDGTTLKAVENWQKLGFDSASAAVLMQVDEVDCDGEAITKSAIKLGALDAVFTRNEQESKDFVQVRKLAYPALERMGRAMLDDVAVPIDKIADLVTRVEKLQQEYGVTIGIFGHAGDGNMHPTIVYPHDDKDAQIRAQQAFEAIVKIAQDLGGTTSGEHGIGAIKTELVKRELSDEVRRLQREIKAVFDPQGILNPGRKYD